MKLEGNECFLWCWEKLHKCDKWGFWHPSNLLTDPESPPWTPCLLWSLPICFSLCPPPQHSGDAPVLGHDMRNIQGRREEGKERASNSYRVSGVEGEVFKLLMSKVNKVKIAVVFCVTAVTDLYVHHWSIQLFTQSTLNDYLLSSRKWDLKEKVRLRREVSWVSGIQSPSKHSTTQPDHLSSSIFLL